MTIGIMQNAGTRKWFDAYQLFLECNHLKVLNEELEFYANNDRWSDGGFNIIINYHPWDIMKA